MNRWHRIRRMRGATFLILIGVLALLNQWGILRWRQSWPLFLIVAGLLLLAERAAWTADVRQQQAVQSFDATAGVSGGQPMPPAPPGASYWPGWSGPPSSSAPEQPLIQTHPPTPEEPGGEDR